MTRVNVHGPVGIIDIVEATSRFVYLKKLNVIEQNVNKPFIDNVLTVDYVPLQTREKNDQNDNTLNDEDSLVDNTDYYAHENSNYEKRRMIVYGNHIKRVKRESDSSSGRITGSMCYVCKIHPRTGRLNLNKCVDKGVQPGPMLGQLKSGKNVTLPDGTVIKSEDVVDPPDPGPLFIGKSDREKILQNAYYSLIFQI